MREILFLILQIQAVISCIYLILILVKRSSLTLANFMIIFCIPVFGPLSALAADLVFKVRKEPEMESIETLSLSEDIYWKTIKKREEMQSIVPLEEALIINDRLTRKKIILEILLEDPMRNLDILLLARENNDVDTAHYANTTISKIQRDFQLQLQKLAVSYEDDPTDQDMLDQYLDTLNAYITSGLAEAYLLKKQRILYAKLLDEKLALESFDKETLNRKVLNSLALGYGDEAIKANNILKQQYPEDEQTWMNAIRISVVSHDARRLQSTMAAVKRRNIEWSPENLELIQSWVEV